MKYSIIVPIYNVEKYLPQCIESVLNQTFDDYELILVDDGSPDKCSKVCDDYSKYNDKIKVVHKTNGGLVSARKAGLMITSGDYVICLDGDDFLHETCLERVTRILDEYNPDVVCFGYVVYSESEKQLNPVYCPHYGFYSRTDLEKEIFPYLIHDSSEKRFPPVVWSKAFRLDLYRKYQNKVDLEISMGEDGACTYPLIFNSNSMVIMDECLYYYRQVSTSMTNIRRPLNWDNYDRVFSIYKKELDVDKYGLRSQINRAMTHNLFNLCKSQFYGEKSYCEAVKIIQKRFRMHPEYGEAIRHSDFSKLQMRIVRSALVNKMYFLIYLYSLFK